MTATGGPIEYDVDGVADVLGVSVTTVYRMIRRGDLPMARRTTRGRSYVISADDLANWIDGRRRPAPD